MSALMGRQSKNSKQRDASDKGQPSPESPTDTAVATSTPMVPSLDDKDKAEAKELVKKNLEIRDILFQMNSDQNRMA